MTLQIFRPRTPMLRTIGSGLLALLGLVIMTAAAGSFIWFCVEWISLRFGS